MTPTKPRAQTTEEPEPDEEAPEQTEEEAPEEETPAEDVITSGTCANCDEPAMWVTTSNTAEKVQFCDAHRPTAEPVRALHDGSQPLAPQDVLSQGQEDLLPSA